MVNSGDAKKARQLSRADYKVSVLVITYNHAEYIEQTIDSILNQKTQFPFEVIIGNDASQDATASRLSKYADRCDIIIVNRTHNIGMNRNVNDLYRRATGDYIALCEGDDFWVDCTKLSRQVEQLESNPAISVVCSNYYIVENTHAMSPSHSIKRRQFTKLQFIREFPNVQTLTLLFRRRMEYLIPPFQCEKVTGSLFIVLRLLEHGELLQDPAYLAAYRVHSGGIWQGKSVKGQANMAVENIAAMQEYFAGDPVASVGLLSLRRRIEGIWRIKILLFGRRDSGPEPRYQFEAGMAVLIGAAWVVACQLLLSYWQRLWSRASPRAGITRAIPTKCRDS